jgi:glycosyltransferase involved in cell wall biosynthesis
LKILQLIDSLSIGGAERMSVNISNVLQSDNIEIVLTTSRKGGDMQMQLDKGVKYYCLNKKNSTDLFAFFKLIRIIDTEKITIIHAHSSSLYWASCVKLLRPNIKLIWHDHFGLSEHLKKYPRKKIIFLSKFIKIDGIISVNSILKNWALENLKIRHNYILVINNFPYLNQFKVTREELPILLNLSNIRPQKDHKTLIETAKILKENNIKFKMIFVGSLEDENLVNYLKNMVVEYNLTNEVDFIGLSNNVTEHLSKATIGLLSSTSEGLPVSLLEYGMANLPVVCTDVGECSQVLGNGEFGWLIKPNDPESFSKSIIEILTYPNQAKAKGIALHKNIAENYGPELFKKKYYELIKMICSK